MGRRIDKATWDERRAWIDKQGCSRFSAAQFCRENGLKLGNFRAWKQKLQGAASVKRQLGGNQTGPANDGLASAFVQVPVPVTSRAAASTSWIEVSLADGMVIRVPASNGPALQLVLSALLPAQETRNA